MPPPNLVLAVNWQFRRRIPPGTIVADVATRSFISTHEHVTLPLWQFRAPLLLLSVGVGNETTFGDLFEALWGDDPEGGPLSPYNCFYMMINNALRRAPWLGVYYRSLDYTGRIEVVRAKTVPPSKLRGPQRMAA